MYHENQIPQNYDGLWVSSEGKIMPSDIFEQGQSLNSENYVKLLETIVRLWMEKIVSARPLSDSKIQTRKSKEWLSEYF